MTRYGFEADPLLDDWAHIWRTVDHRLPDVHPFERACIAYCIYEEWVRKDVPPSLQTFANDIKIMPSIERACRAYLQRSY